MKITKVLVKEFERQQKEHGTEVAIHNLMFLIADEIIKDIGKKRVQTSEYPVGRRSVIVNPRRIEALQ